LRRMLEYKADWYGRTVLAVDRFYPSSKTCSACGAITASMPLSVREWTCAACGTAHDRDVNAAKVILAEGLSVAACGDGVRPPRA
jgi:putative transposase